MERKYHAKNSILKDLTRFNSSYTAFTIKDNYNSDICSMYCGSNKCICNFGQDLSNGNMWEVHGWIRPFQITGKYTVKRQNRLACSYKHSVES